MNTVRERARNHMAKTLSLDVAWCRDPVALSELAVNSFRLVEMAIELQEELGVRFSQDDLLRVATIGDLLDLVERRARSVADER